MEKSDYSLELIKTKVDLQDQMLKQILFLQTNSQKISTEHTMAMLKMQKSVERMSKLNQQKEILQQSKFSLKNIVALQKETIGTLEEKIGMVDDERKQLTERLNKAERELKVMTNKLANFSNLKAKFIKLENKWGYIAEHFFVDQKKIIHNNKFESKIGNVAINGGKVEYSASNSARELNNMIRVYGQNKFNKEAADPLFDSIFYFEIEFQNIEEVNQRGEMALIGIDSNKSTILTLSCCCSLSDKLTKSVNISVLGKLEKIRYPNMSWKSGDAKLYEQIKILEDAKTDLDNLVKQTSKNFRENIAIIGDKQKEIETKQCIENKEFGIKLQEMKIEIDKMIKDFTSLNRENKENKNEIQKMGKQIDKLVKEQVS
uniref:Uncharacterized protein n=1 Tax=Meloidogyne javanica TaxID=6303 RepID=A0A915NCD7_MELJA